MAAKGGLASDITVGDCLELVKAGREAFPGVSVNGRHSPFFYQMLHALGVFPPGAPPTVRMFASVITGKLDAGQLVDRYDLACRPVRDLLADYLRERQPGVDYITLNGLSAVLALWFWKDLETHHPGISSLRLPPDIAAAWKQRLQVRAAPAGGEATAERYSAGDVLSRVRAFYLDLAEWAEEDPAQWGPWAVPCPVRASDIQHRQRAARRKARMDQRTRERLPVLPALCAAVARNRQEAAARLQAGAAAAPGELFTPAGVTLRRTVLAARRSARTWAEDPETGKRRDLTREESDAFWAWATVEVLRTTGIRAEELTELSHHSLVQYRLPSTGELIPLLSVAPSKTDEERLLVISPELADVLSAIICRIRRTDGSVPAIPAYDPREKTWNPPMPLLFQRPYGLEIRPIPDSGIRALLATAITAAAITGTGGRPLHFTPHDFRRVFATDAILNGMPPHIAQLILGHRDINTTMGYKAVSPRKPSTATAPSSPAAASCAPARNTAPPPTPNGKSSSATSSAASSPSATAEEPTEPAASTSTAASAAPPAHRPSPAAPARGDPRQPHRPHRRSRTRRLDRRSGRTAGQPHRRRGETRPGRRHHRPPQRRRPRHPRLPRHRRSHRHPAGPAMTRQPGRAPAIRLPAAQAADLTALLTTLDEFIRSSPRVTAELRRFLAGRGSRFPGHDASLLTDTLSFTALAFRAPAADIHEHL